MKLYCAIVRTKACRFTAEFPPRKNPQYYSEVFLGNWILAFAGQIRILDLLFSNWFHLDWMIKGK
jgi:hypothetical protein